MYSSILSAVVQGLQVTIVCVEMDVSNGLPSLQIVGSASTEVKEAGERVRTAIKNLGYQLPAKKIIGNLTPANIRKVGTGFDLAIAISLLAAYELISVNKIKDVLVIGEIGLDGCIHPVHAILPIMNAAKAKGIRTFIIPKENEQEGAVIGEVCIYAVSHLQEVIRHFTSEPLKAVPYLDFHTAYRDTKEVGIDFDEIQGQEPAKRAVQIAVAGNHNFAMIGSPGSGKSMIAQRIPTIQPELTIEESIPISEIYSIRGLLNADTPLIVKRPFRDVHHTVTKAALIGGGTVVKPGELSLAHGGVLFLDELPEFNKNVLEVLRQPLEAKKVRIIRSKGCFEFPADVMLVAAMNPCPCGNYPDRNRCICSEYDIQRYLGKISQPLWDRIDICVDVARVEYDMLQNTNNSTSSCDMKEKVEIARAIQQERFRGTTIRTNAVIPTKFIRTYCSLNTEGHALMKMAYQKLNLTARTYYKILKVARTIADMDAATEIQLSHLREAIGYRSINIKDWRG